MEAALAADWAIAAPARNRAGPAEHFAQQNLRERNQRIAVREIN